MESLLNLDEEKNLRKVDLSIVNCEYAETTEEERDASWTISKGLDPVKLVKDKDNNYMLMIQADPEKTLLVKVNDLKEVNKIRDNIVLNVQKAILDGEKINAENAEEIKMNDHYRTFGRRTDKSFIVSVDDLRIGEERFGRTREVADYLISKATREENGEQVVDFDEAKYFDAAHMALMKRMYSKEIVLTDEQKEGMKYYKRAGFMSVNALMRGGEKNFEFLFTYLKNHDVFHVDDLTKSIIQMERIAEALPDREFNLAINRQGTGVGKNTEIGARNIYDSFVSFATNKGMRTGDSNDLTVNYRSVLRRDDNALPIEIICPRASDFYMPECEIIGTPFEYEVAGFEESYNDYTGRVNAYNVKMNKVRDISVTDVLEQRLNELREFLLKTKESYSHVDEILLSVNSEQALRHFNYEGYQENPDVEQVSLADVLEFYSKRNEISKINDFDKKIQNDTLQYDSETHGANHTRRVAFFTRFIADKMGLGKDDKDLLLFIAQNHDVGREHDWEDKDHGTKSAEIISSKGNNRMYAFSEEDKDLIKFIISNHSRSSRENEAALEALPEDKKAKYKLMLSCFKDADKLDRVRLGKYDGLNPDRLELPISKQMVRLAYETNYVWRDFSSIIDYKSKGIDRLLEETTRALDIVAKEKETPSTEVIHTEEFRYFDDPKIDRSEVLADIIDSSKESTGLSRINGVVTRFKDKVKAALGIGTKEKNNDEQK